MREASWDQARELARSLFPTLPSQSVAIAEAVGRTLAEDMYSLCDLPAFETSSMDGWAVGGSGPWRVIGDVQMGKAPTEIIVAGECMRISTGGVVPRGAEAVIPWEKVTQTDSLIAGTIEAGANIRPAGAECKEGDLLFASGTRLTPPMVGLLAATGHDRISVSAKPKVAIFFLGDELIHQGVPRDGAIRDALGPQIPGHLELLGCEVISRTFVKDELDSLVSEIHSALGSVDLIVTTGGTADSPRDFVKPAIAALGGVLELDCARVRPGYHILIAALPVVEAGSDKKLPLIALPGNPQSAIAALTSFGKPLIDSLLGAELIALNEITLEQSFKTQPDFARLIPGTLTEDRFTPTQYLGSAMLRGVAAAHGFAVISSEGESSQSARWLALPRFDY